jgi:hypothetical protein
MPPPRQAKYEPHQAVIVNYRGKGVFHPATILVANPDGTYNVRFEDGDQDSNVASWNLKDASEDPEHGRQLEAPDLTHALFPLTTMYAGWLSAEPIPEARPRWWNAWGRPKRSTVKRINVEVQPQADEGALEGKGKGRGGGAGDEGKGGGAGGAEGREAGGEGSGEDDERHSSDDSEGSPDPGPDPDDELELGQQAVYKAPCCAPPGERGPNVGLALLLIGFVEALIGWQVRTADR